MLASPPFGVVFQSTPSVGRATSARMQTTKPQEYFNPRPPWGGRHKNYKPNSKTTIFQSTPSVGRATTSRLCRVNVVNLISIHALRGEGDDAAIVFDSSIQANFNPRPPWGGRPEQIVSTEAYRPEFQSTPSVGRATDAASIYSSHSFYFNPRPPWGGRQYERA